MRITPSVSGSLILMVFSLGTARADAEQTRIDESASQVPSVLAVPAEAQPSANFNVEAATRAYLATIPAAAKARSDSYVEGGYWLTLWNFLFGAAMALVILNLRWSAAIRNAAERVTRFKWVHAVIYWAGYLALTTALTFPLALYQGYFCEHQYGLATQTFGPWLVDRIKGFGVGLVMGAIIVPLLFVVARRLRRTWFNASRQPDGFAQAAIHLSEYPKMEPGPLEEWIFSDHPSGRTRIFAATRWKAAEPRGPKRCIVGRDEMDAPSAFSLPLDDHLTFLV